MPQLQGRDRPLWSAVPARGRTVHWLAVLLFALPALLLPAATTSALTTSSSTMAAGQHSSTPTAASDRPSQATYLQAETAVAVPVTRSVRAHHLRDSRWWPVSPAVEMAAPTRPGDGFAESTSTRASRPTSASSDSAAPRGPPASGAFAL